MDMIRTEKWSRTETSWITALIAIPHIISTILIGILIGIIGYKLSSAHELVMRATAPLILIVIGLVYVSLDFKDDSKHHHQDFIKSDSLSKNSKFAIIFPLATALFFSPCVAMVNTALKGVKKLEWHFLERHEKLVTGVVLIFLGVLIYFMEM
jgi:putative Mn2+ efflux pump MntP